MEKISPIDGNAMASVRTATPYDYEQTVERTQQACLIWKSTPAPLRGETICQLGKALREYKSELGKLDRAKLAVSLDSMRDQSQIETTGSEPGVARPAKFH